MESPLRRRFAVFFGAAVLALLAAPTPSAACGLTPPIGPSGLPAVCHGDDASLRLRAGLVLGGTSTRIDFGEQHASLLQGALGATLDVMPLERLTLSGSLGASLPGRLRYQSRDFDLRPGPMAGVGVAYRLLGGRLPFVHGSLTFSWSRSATRAPDGVEGTFTSRDYRLGLALGKTLGTVAAPFVVARYFGAGTTWSLAGHGADHYRYQVGVGSALALSARFDVLVELAFLGEGRAVIGAGYVF